MISIAIILSLTIGFIAALCVYWKNIVGWIKKAANKIKEVLGIAVQGTRTFIEKTATGFQNRSKYYNENKITGEWEERIYTQIVPESEIPPEILEKVRNQPIGQEVSTTEELQLVLAN